MKKILDLNPDPQIYSSVFLCKMASSSEKSRRINSQLVCDQQPPVTIGQRSIEYVDIFPYLGSYICRIGDAVAEVDTRARLGKA